MSIEYKPGKYGVHDHNPDGFVADAIKNDFASIYVYNQPPQYGWVEIAPGYKMAVIGRWPNAFHRWTTRLAFGWRWERTND